MTAELFVKWIQHFIEHVRPTANKKALLILDGHSSHKSYQALELAKSRSIVLMCLPANCTHHQQPLDVGFFGPLHKYYNQTVTHWLKEHPGRTTVTIYQVSELFNDAYERTATLEIASSAFRATGILPFNANIFPDHLFLPSLTTDVPEVEQEEQDQKKDQEPQTNNEEMQHSSLANLQSKSSQLSQQYPKIKHWRALQKSSIFNKFYKNYHQCLRAT